MVSSVRNLFNKDFTGKQYQEYLQKLNAPHPGHLEFRIAETPVFCDRAFRDKIMSACENIVDIIASPTFKSETASAIPAGLDVPNEDAYAKFITFDFGICQNAAGEIEPQLIEMQGFPTIFAFQAWQEQVSREVFAIPDNYESYFNGFNYDSYIQFLSEILLNGHLPDQVILLEIFPEQQKTRVDFYFTEDYTGIKTVCLTKLIKKGKKLFYLKDEVETEIKRIYNRVIFDDLQQQTPEVREKGKVLFEEVDVEWVPHPNWFFRISKFTLPFIDNPFVPKTQFLDKIGQVPEDLENYVLKPLFSFAGQGVIIDVTKKDIEAVERPEEWILQRKVKYADIIETPDGPAKAEIRIFYFWKEGAERPVATNNLARISKGKMIGVRYNKDKTWVGGTVAYFEK